MVAVKSYAAIASRTAGKERSERTIEARDAAAHENARARAAMAPKAKVKIVSRGTYLLVQEECSLRAEGVGEYVRDTRKINNFADACQYAEELDPGCFLRYIPIHGRAGCHFSGNTLHTPKFGPLHWVGDGPRPDDAWQMARTKLYVVNKCVGDSVYGTVTKSKGQFPDIEWREDGTWWVRTDKMHEWIEDAVREWKSKVPEEYHGVVSDLSRDQVADLFARKQMSKGQFMEWLDQYAWNLHMDWDGKYQEWERLADSWQERLSLNE